MLPTTIAAVCLSIAGMPGATGLRQQKPEGAATEVPADAVSITVSMKQTAIRADEQPTFTAKFRNTSKDYVELYDLEAYWEWDVRFCYFDRQYGIEGPWRLSFDKAGPAPAGIKYLPAGGSLDVKVDLNDPVYTFQYVWEGAQNRPIQPIRHLTPGSYLMGVTVSLKSPFGPGYHMWLGPGAAKQLVLQVKPAGVRKPSRGELDAWNEAIDSVASIVKDPYGLWQNGFFPVLDLPQYASAEDVVAAAVNRALLGSKAYKVLLTRDLGGPERMSAALVTVGKQYKVLLYYYIKDIHWWTRFYDVSIGAEK